MNNQIEIWKDINGFEGYYQVSSYGRIKSFDRYVEYKTHAKKVKGQTIKGKLMSLSLCKGYQIVRLNKLNVSISYRVNRLVAEHFIPNPENKPQVNHKDCNKLNNHLSNLEWATSKENSEHASINGLYKCPDHKKKQMSEYFSKKYINTKTGEIYNSMKEASLKTGIKYNTVNGMVNKYKNSFIKHYEVA